MPLCWYWCDEFLLIILGSWFGGKTIHVKWHFHHIITPCEHIHDVYPCWCWSWSLTRVLCVCQVYPLEVKLTSLTLIPCCHLCREVTVCRSHIRGVVWVRFMKLLRLLMEHVSLFLHLLIPISMHPWVRTHYYLILLQLFPLWPLVALSGGFCIPLTYLIVRSFEVVFIYFILFICWLYWVFVAAHRLSLVVGRGGYSLAAVSSFSLQGTGSRTCGLSSLVALWHVWSSRIRDQTCVPCVGRQFLTSRLPGEPLK